MCSALPDGAGSASVTLMFRDRRGLDLDGPDTDDAFVESGVDCDSELSFSLPSSEPLVEVSDPSRSLRCAEVGT